MPCEIGFPSHGLSMTSTRWERIQSLYERARTLEAYRRSDFLETACDDPELRLLVTEMLEARESGELQIESRLLTRDPVLGTQFGHYRAERRIGQGGNADVYFGVRVGGEGPASAAIKILRDQGRGDQLVRRFSMERSILERLQHPNIARILDGGVTPGEQHYLVMEFVDGMVLSEYLSVHAASHRRRLELFGEICEAVRFAHGQDVLHRDLKTSNVMVTAAGAAVLLDFGIAKLLGASDGIAPNLVTPAGVRLLTPSNAAPERVLGHPATVETDVYGLGLILYEMMSGCPALDPAGMSWIEWETTVLQVVPTPLSQSMEAPVVELDAIVARALEKRSESRYPSVAALAADVTKAVESLRG